MSDLNTSARRISARLSAAKGNGTVVFTGSTDAAQQLLVNIGANVATMHKRPKLLRIIFEQAQPVFGFHDVGLFVRSGDGQWLTDWARAEPHTDPSASSEHFPSSLGSHRFPYTGSLFEEFAEQIERTKRPLLGHFNERYPDRVIPEAWGEAYAPMRAAIQRVITDSGYQQYLCTTLRSGGEVLGVLMFNATAPATFCPEQFGCFRPWPIWWPVR